MVQDAGEVGPDGPLREEHRMTMGVRGDQVGGGCEAAVRVLVVGNSGSGKSTLAAGAAARGGWVHVDLDTVAWEDAVPPERAPLERSLAAVRAAVAGAAGWVVEGCYADILEALSPEATHLVFVDRSPETCRRHAVQRPWEPHKFPSREAQDAHLAALLAWIDAYPGRDGPLGRAAHEALFATFGGRRWRVTDEAPGPPDERWYAAG